VFLWEIIYLILYLFSLEYPGETYYFFILHKWLTYCHHISIWICWWYKVFQADHLYIGYQVSKDVNSLFNWSINNFLSFNLSEFIFMSFHHKYIIQHTLSMATDTINKYSSCKDLHGNYFHKCIDMARTLWNDLC